jgi:glyoxylate utilization-related uncharacterized protein
MESSFTPPILRSCNTLLHPATRLFGDSWYPVAAADCIRMAAYCPKWFGALGQRRAKYLIYKGWNCHPVA